MLVADQTYLAGCPGEAVNWAIEVAAAGATAVFRRVRHQAGLIILDGLTPRRAVGRGGQRG